MAQGSLHSDPLRNIIPPCHKSKDPNFGCNITFIFRYFGIQSEDNDYFFDEEWKAFEKQRLLEVKLAQSRKDPAKKLYVQNLLEEDVDYIHQHLFKNNGVIFICGGSMMAREVNNVIFKALTQEVKLPYKAFSLSS